MPYRPKDCRSHRDIKTNDSEGRRFHTKKLGTGLVFERKFPLMGERETYWWGKINKLFWGEWG